MAKLATILGTAALLVAWVGASAFGDRTPGSWAEYAALKDDGPQSVASFRVDVLPDEAGAGSAGRWYELAATKRNGDVYRVKLLAEGNPFAEDATDATTPVSRYIVQEGRDRALEYRDRHANRVLTPTWGLIERLLPRLAAGTTAFPATARYLGWDFTLVSSGSSGARSGVAEPEVLDLDPSLLVGTYMTLRDKRMNRRYDESDYSYVPWTRRDFQDALNAGVNLFSYLSQETEEIVRRKPVFYYRWSGVYQYPELLYRSNCLGSSMFTDEPAIRFVERGPKSTRRDAAPTPDVTPAAYAKALEAFTRDAATEQPLLSRRTFQNFLDGAKPPVPRRLELPQGQIPVWETYISPSWYMCRAGAYGVVEEGRWQIDDLRLFNAAFDVRIPVSAENLLKLEFASLRGAARIFNTPWGASVYGQADPEIAQLAVKMAYDMGARYIWWWSQDHGHHVPFDEQLGYARLVRDHEQSRPPRDLAALVRAAHTAIALPYGYTLGRYDHQGVMSNPILHLDRTNARGKTFRQVLQAAAVEVERCIRENVPFDIVVQDVSLAAAGYAQVVAIGEDARVTVNGQLVAGDRTPAGRETRQPPQISIRVEPRTGVAPLALSLNAAATRPGVGSPGATDRTHVRWQIVPDPGVDMYAELEQRDIPHMDVTLKNPGKYVVRAIAYDDAGAATSAVTTVTVLARARAAAGR